MVGHFPVYFQSKDENSFKVDKTEQAKVTEKVTVLTGTLREGTVLWFMSRRRYAELSHSCC